MCDRPTDKHMEGQCFENGGAYMQEGWGGYFRKEKGPKSASFVYYYCYKILGMALWILIALQIKSYEAKSILNIMVKNKEQKRPAT